MKSGLRMTKTHTPGDAESCAVFVFTAGSEAFALVQAARPSFLSVGIKLYLTWVHLKALRHQIMRLGCSRVLMRTQFFAFSKSNAAARCSSLQHLK